MGSMNILKPNISAWAFSLAAAACACGLLPADATRAQAAPATASATVTQPALARFLGNWEGTVAYRNVLTGDISRAAATMTGKPKGDKVLLDLLLDNGKGQLVRQPFTISVNPVQQTFTRDPGDEQVTLRLTSGTLTPAAADPLALVLEARGSEQAVPMDLRETIDIVGDTMVWKREMKPDGGNFGFRSEYRFTRKP